MIYNTKKKLIIALVITGALVLAVMAMIFYFSSCDGTESSAQSGRVTKAIAKIFIPHLDDMTAGEKADIIEKMTFYTRKAAHFLEFMLLGVVTSVFILLLKKKIYIAFVFSVLYAISDEIHQIFTDGRGPSAVDVLIDSLGVAFGIGIICLCVYLKKRAGENNETAADA